MAFEFRLPDVGEGLAEAEIVAWRVAVGDAVAMDQVVVEVETDKAVVEIPIPVAGTVLHLGGAEGDTVEVGTVLVVIGEPDESWPPPAETAPEPQEETSGTEAEDAAAPEVATPEDAAAESDQDEADAAAVTGSDAAPIVGTLDADFTVLGAAEEATSDQTSHVRALPVVRKLARELGVDLTEVRGTGPHGRITRDDVTAAAEAGASEPRVQDYRDGGLEPRVQDDPPTEDEPRAQDHRAEGGEDSLREGRRMSRVRRTIAERMSRSWSEIPHVTTFDEVDATRLLEVKRALSKRTGFSIPLDALVVKAVVPALAAHPDFNARLDGDRLIDPESVDMGVAVDTPDGLMVIVIRNASDLSLTEVAREVTRLAEAAKDRKTTPAEMSGQTFTVSNIGAVGGGHGTPIVPYGTIGILSVGRAVDRPVARDGRVTIAPMMPLSLSYDHRVIDGGEGRRFIAQIVENLTEPALFLAE